MELRGEKNIKIHTNVTKNILTSSKSKLKIKYWIPQNYIFSDAKFITGHEFACKY